MREYHRFHEQLLEPAFRRSVVAKLNWDAVLERYRIKTKRRSTGTHYALCSWHAEKRPSLAFSPTSQRFHCYGCGKSGDIIDFIAMQVSWERNPCKELYRTIIGFAPAFEPPRDEFPPRQLEFTLLLFPRLRAPDYKKLASDVGDP